MGIAGHGQAGAVTREVAEKMLANVQLLPVPTKQSTDFQHWAYNTATFTALGCLRSAGVTAPRWLGDSRVTASGSYSLENGEELEAACTAIAEKGVQPRCGRATVWIDGVKLQPGIPQDYLQVSGNLNNLKISGALTCALSEQGIARQTFAPKVLTYSWSQLPHMQSITLSGGPRMLNIGNITIEAPTALGYGGRPFMEPKMALKVD